MRISKEKIEEILKSNKLEATELDKETPYIIQIEVNDDENTSSFLKYLANKLHELGLEKFVIVPIINGTNKMKFIKINDEEYIDIKN